MQIEALLLLKRASEEGIKEEKLRKRKRERGSDNKQDEIFVVHTIFINVIYFSCLVAPGKAFLLCRWIEIAVLMTAASSLRLRVFILEKKKDW